MPYRHEPGQPGDHRVRNWTIAAILATAAFVALVAVMSSCATVAQDEVGFAVGGGPLDPNKRKVKGDLMEPGMRLTGTLDGVWKFPAYNSPRFQDFDVAITTRDNRSLTLHGQVRFQFVGDQDPALAKKFATGIGARKYGGDRPGENDDGWSAFLDQLVVPEINGGLKDAAGRRYCAEFEPICRAIDPRATVPPTDSAAVYRDWSRDLQGRIDAGLGGTYLRNVRVQVTKIDKPENLEANVNRVAEEQAKTQAARQAQQTADAEAKVIQTKGDALRKNPELVPVEVAKACGGECSIIVDGTGNGVRPSVSVGR